MSAPQSSLPLQASDRRDGSAPGAAATDDDRLARVVLSCGVEPGDGTTSSLVRQIGAVQTLRDSLVPKPGSSLAERLAANSRADVEGRRPLKAARAAVRLEEESRREEELQEASRRAVTNYVRSSRMGARVDYYRRHARDFATLETDRVPAAAPYVVPPVGTFADTE